MAGKMILILWFLMIFFLGVWWRSQVRTGPGDNLAWAVVRWVGATPLWTMGRVCWSDIGKVEQSWGRADWFRMVLYRDYWVKI